MSEAQRKRREALGIPYHELDKDHDFRADGYCNCGVRQPFNPKDNVQFAGTAPEFGSRTAGKVTLDVYDNTHEYSEYLTDDAAASPPTTRDDD